MSDNLPYFLDELRRVAQAPVLCDPADIRRAGEHRMNVRRGVVTLSVTLALAVAGFTALASGTGDLGPADGDPSDRTSSPGVTGTAPNAPLADCRPGDLDPLPYYGVSAAMGTTYHTIMVQNASPTRCRLSGHPSVRFTEPATGAAATMPTAPREEPNSIVLEAAGWSTVAIAVASRNPYGPGAPECARPQSYGGLSLVIGDGRNYPLPWLSLSWECGGASISSWTASEGPASMPELLTRAHPPTSEPG